MVSEAWSLLSTWSSLDTWIVATAALAAMACSLPGVFLVVRRQSLMGDALSHSVLPGIVLAFLLTHGLENAGWISSDVHEAWRHAAMLGGALVIGVVMAVLTEWVQKTGQVEASAALGVVFTTLFALGLLLVRLAADKVDIDPDCVLYGTIETIVMDTLGESDIPRAAGVNAAMLVFNLLLIRLFYKELQVSAFDPSLARAMGFHAGLTNHALMAVTAATLVAAFESVGSILVLAMLIVPAATARLLTDRLSSLLGVSLLLAALSALFGHVLAITVPPILFHRLGYPTVADASTAGMMAVAAGIFLLAAALFGPRHGVVSRFLDQVRLGLGIAAEDVLGMLYRFEESALSASSPARPAAAGPVLQQLATWWLSWQGNIARQGTAYRLTERGRRRAEELVRSHRLWESYMARHFSLPDDHLHDSAERAEHFIDVAIRQGISAELDAPVQDPHGREIPSERPLSSGEHPA